MSIGNREWRAFLFQNSMKLIKILNNPNFILSTKKDIVKATLWLVIEQITGKNPKCDKNSKLENIVKVLV